MLTYEIANNIVQETMNRLDRNINFIDMEGIIIASGTPSRIGELHEGALEAIQRGQTIIISEGMKHHWDGTLMGMNIPVYFQNQIVGAIGITGDPEEVSIFAELVRMTTELMLNQWFLNSQQEWRIRTKEDVLKELMKPDPDFKQINNQLEMLKLEMEPPYQAFVLQMNKGIEHNSMLIKKIEGIFGMEQVLVGLLDGRRACVFVFGYPEQKLMQKLEIMKALLLGTGLPFHMGCSSLSVHREEITAIIGEAKFALKFIRKDHSLISYKGLESQRIVDLSDQAAKNRFMERILRDMSESALLTLQTYFDCNMNIRETAEALFLHKNTVIYRLKKVKEISGHDPQIFHEALSLQVALWIYKAGDARAAW